VQCSDDSLEPVAPRRDPNSNPSLVGRKRPPQCPFPKQCTAVLSPEADVIEIEKFDRSCNELGIREWRPRMSIKANVAHGPRKGEDKCDLGKNLILRAIRQIVPNGRNRRTLLVKRVSAQERLP